jgi:predicted transcriptional regulator
MLESEKIVKLNGRNENRRDRSERFEIAFNQIHLKLKELLQGAETDSFVYLLNKAREKHAAIRYHYDALRQYAKLRNAMVHEKVKEAFYIADPHEDIVYEIERISRVLWEPPSALSIASTEVKCFKPTTPLKEILEAIEHYGYAQFPIYEQDQFIGLLTEGGLAKWFSHSINQHSISIEHVTVKDILKIDKLRHVKFLSQTSSLFDVEEVYESSFDRNKKLAAVILTQDGSRNQEPIGIITSWDLIHVDRKTVSISI